ncbi:amidase family protein [Cupriavidus basilensis]
MASRRSTWRASAARSARDLRTSLHALAGPDGSDALAYRLALPPCDKHTLADFRVAVLSSHPLCEADTEVSDEIERLGRWLESQGAQVRWNARPDFDAAALWHTYVLMLRATTSIHMDDTSFDTALARAAGAAPEDHSYATLQFTGAGIRHRQWLQLQQARATFAQSWQRFFGEVDVLLCPAAATTALPWTRRASRGSARFRSTAGRNRSPASCSGPGTPACAACPRRWHRSARAAAACRWGCRSSPDASPT